MLNLQTFLNQGTGRGISGFSGVVGISGYSGLSGYSGYSGISGYSGTSGYSGISGYSAYSGTSGYSGSSGISGYSGAVGMGFTIAKTYSSVAELLADTSPTGIVAGQFAVVDTGNVDDIDTGKLYLWNGVAYQYVTDLSGAQGIKGESGTSGASGYSGISGYSGSSGYSGFSGIGSIVSSETPPSSPAEGMLWFNLIDGIEYRYVNDGNSLQWVASASPTYIGFSGWSGYSGMKGDIGLVNLAGSASIFVNTSTIYTITNYNIGSTYTVSVNAGSVTRNESVISFTAPATAQTVTLSITKDGYVTPFYITIDATGIYAPQNISPTNTQTNVFNSVPLQSSPFTPFGISDTHASSDWQLATDAGFANIVQSLSADTTNKISWQVASLSAGTTYYWHVRYRGSSGAVSNWSAATSFSTKASFVNDIGTPGTVGFGVGICDSLPSGMSVLAGSNVATSDNYGNYQYTDGSIMVWVPAFYYKWGTGTNGLNKNDVSIKNYNDFADVATANASGYALHRAFYDGGEIKTGFFVDKYGCSNNSGVASSIKNGNPLSSNSAHNPFSALTGSPGNYYYGAISAAKTRGSNFFCASLFIHKALALLSYAHGRAATGSTYCAWWDDGGVTNFPKGNNINALKDTNDTSVIWVSDGYSNCGKTGSAGSAGGAGNVFAKSTHNGQNCGIADLNGNMWEIAPGITSNSTNLYILKTSTSMKSVTGGNSNSTDLWGSAGISALYDDLGTTFGALWANSANRTTYYGNANQVFNEATSGNGWNATGAGVPLAGGVGGTNAFGNDVLLDYKPNEMCPISGGSWYDGSGAGVWALDLTRTRSYSAYGVGLRAALYL